MLILVFLDRFSEVQNAKFVSAALAAAPVPELGAGILFCLVGGEMRQQFQRHWVSVEHLSALHLS